MKNKMMKITALTAAFAAGFIAKETYPTDPLLNSYDRAANALDSAPVRENSNTIEQFTQEFQALSKDTLEPVEHLSQQYQLLVDLCRSGSYVSHKAAIEIIEKNALSQESLDHLYVISRMDGVDNVARALSKAGADVTAIKIVEKGHDPILNIPVKVL